MTKKDFELIAGVLRADAPNCLRTPITHETGKRTRTVRDMVAEAFADALATTNPRFDRARFIAAATGSDSNE